MASNHSELSRRGLLRAATALSAAGLILPSFHRRLFADEAPTTASTVPGFGKAKQVVFLYMIGGPSHFETFDPKPGTSSGGPTRTVETALPGVHIADSLPGLAKRIAEEKNRTESNGAIWANQFDNVANRQGHYQTTGP